MECGLPVITRLAALFFAFLLSGPALAQTRVVLVVGAASPIEAISSFELRKIYLGIDVMKNGHFVHGLRNISQPQLNGIFLQTAVGLSAERYERRLLSNVLKYGALRPPEFADENRLIAALHADPYAVSYMRINNDNPPPGIKVLRVVWQDSCIRC
jgi:hypothetical protein